MNTAAGNKPLVVLALRTGDYRSKLARLVQGAGATVLAVECGGQALQLSRELCPEAMVIDTALSDMRGGELCDALRADEAIPHMSIVLLTETRDLQTRIAGFISGAQRCVCVTDDIEDLVNSVSVLLNRENRARAGAPCLQMY